MSEEYINEVIKMGKDVENIMERVVKLELSFKALGLRLDDLETRNKNIEREDIRAVYSK
tara:strand:+ start:369 stop:545 length:177 start_codon:yes stop_codon:yes gene_type:complete